MAWRRTADLAGKYCSKGKEVALEVKQIYPGYEDKDGNKCYVTEINCNELLMRGR